MTRLTSIIKNIIMILCVVMFLLPATAEETIIIRTDNTSLDILENSYSTLRVRHIVSKIGFENFETKSGSYTRLRVADYGRSNIAGEPELPVLKKLIEIPLGAEINVDISSISYQEYSLEEYGIINEIFPVQPPVTKNIDNPLDLKIIKNQQSYSKDQFLGQEIVTFEIVGTMRGVKIARLEIAPVQYNPVQKTIRVYDHLEAKISFLNGDIIATQNQKKTLFSPFVESIYSNIFNYKSLSPDELILDAPATYIIVSDPMFESLLQPFVAWKIRKGFNVVEAYSDNPLVGNTTESIKEYLEDFYNNPPEGFLPQSYVLIVGDVDQVPAFDGVFGYHATDLYYGEYTGDILPDCYYGRFSANTIEELQPQLAKTLEYEKYEFPEPSYLDSALLVAGYAPGIDTIWGNGQINYAANYYINEDHGIYPFVYPQPEPTGINYQELIMDRFNNGISIFNYTGHCSYFGFLDPMFTSAQVFQLTNAHKYPIVIGNCCNPGAFHLNCFGETIVRVEEKGALSFIGPANSTYWNEDFWWAVGFKDIVSNPVYDPEHLGVFDRWFHDHGEPTDEWFVTQGQFTVAGNLAVTEAGTGVSDYYWEAYHLLGDPSVNIYLPEPSLPEVDHAESLTSEDTVFIVTTEPYLYVALSMNGVLHGAAVSDENGNAEISIFEPFSQSGIAEIVITGQNIEPYFGSVEVVLTSISEYNPVLGYVTVSPNPFTENVKLSFNLEPFTNLHIKLVDLLGKTIKDYNLTEGETILRKSFEIPTSELTPGLYFIQIESGGILETFKIIKSG